MTPKDHSLRKVLFIDIETVSRYKRFEELDASWQNLWELKHSTFQNNTDTAADSYEKRAAIFAEFGKVICISLGYFHKNKNTNSDEFRVKSFFDSDEKTLLTNFALLLEKYFSDEHDWQLCGHNIKEFDIPFLCRRMMANGIKLPEMLDLSGRKPWEVNIIDTMQQWKFGDYKNYTSLKLIAATLDIPSPKDDIEGKDVGHVYWNENNLPRIVTYCQRDVITVARILMKIKGETHLLSEAQITIQE